MARTVRFAWNNQMAAPDALMFREVEDGTVWDVLRVAAARVSEFEAKGWALLLSSADLQSAAIEEVRKSEEDRWRRG